jgi:DHA1 family bicyclomycin/chloramphenicol resistance-like MFS transporter
MKKLIGLLALLSAFPPLSTDMYLAAIPLLVEQWHEPLATVNLTLVCFFFTYCCFLLIYGPLSDRYGRRPPLLAGISLYVLASLFCALAGSVEVMILARTLQGAGAASASAIALAICKDRFDGQLRQRIFIQIGIIVAAAPMLAPVIGGWIIELSSWRLVFLVQALMGAVTLVGVLRMEESLPSPSSESLSRVVFGYLRLFRNSRYILLALTYAVMGIPFFAFIAASADIYITQLGYSERQYGYFFALNSFAFMVAPIAFSRSVKHVPLMRLLPIGYLGMICSATLMTTHWLPLPWRIALPMWLFTFSFSFTRPPGNNLILEQVDTDVGAASAFMVFIFFITGATAMWAISLDWPDKINTLGWLGVTASTFTICAWFLLTRFVRLRLP